MVSRNVYQRGKLELRASTQNIRRTERYTNRTTQFQRYIAATQYLQSLGDAHRNISVALRVCIKQGLVHASNQTKL